MTRLCVVTGKTVAIGNNVSHANNKTRRRFLPNIQEQNVYSELLQQSFRLKISVAGLRTLEHKGGLDALLLGTAKTKLDPELRPIKARVEDAAKAQGLELNKAPAEKKAKPSAKATKTAKKAA